MGIRWSTLKADVEALGIRASRKADWTEPFVGVRVASDLAERWSVLSEASAGGFGAGSRLTVDAAGYLGYTMRWLGHPTVLRGGYRVLCVDFRDGRFHGPQVPLERHASRTDRRIRPLLLSEKTT